MKPVVDGLEKELSGRLTVIRVDIHTEAGREIARQYKFQYTPTFIMFDEDGNELWREVGSLNAEWVKQSVEGE